MAIHTSIGATPWTTGELAALHGCAGPRAKAKQEDLDVWFVRRLAPEFVERGSRADQAVACLLARMARLLAMHDREPRTVESHLRTLVKRAHDAAAERRMSGAAKRLGGGTRAAAPSVARRQRTA